MIRLIWSVLCKNSAVDKDSNSVSLFDILEQITLLEEITEKGQVPLQFQLVNLWTRMPLDEPSKGVARIRLLLPTGDWADKVTQLEVDLSKARRLRQRIGFVALPVVQAGVYEFVVEVRSGEDWNEVSRVPLELAVEPQNTSS